MLDQHSLQALGLSDASLLGIDWTESGRDVAISLAHATGGSVKLVCAWAHSRKIELLTKPRHAGQPLLWEATLVPDGHEWRLKLDFAGDGSIELLCGSVSLGPLA